MSTAGKKSVNLAAYEIGDSYDWSMSAPAKAHTLRSAFVKVPEVTIYFWLIKVLATTVGETFADYLNTTLNFGLTGTSLFMTALLVAVLAWQFRLNRYVAPVYWLAVVLISVTGTLLTDNLTDNLNVSLVTSSVIFAVALALTFLGWQRSEGTLSIHSVDTKRREAWYWLTILFTFALGTALGDLFAERISLGYFSSGLVFAGAIALVAVLWRAGWVNAILAFWSTYVLTRPLGASIGDYLSQPKDTSGIGLGTTVTSMIFLGAILVLVVFLYVTKVDVPDSKRD